MDRLLCSGQIQRGRQFSDQQVSLVHHSLAGPQHGHGECKLSFELNQFFLEIANGSLKNSDRLVLVIKIQPGLMQNFPRLPQRFH